ncbi:MAG TPA: hypothetical protein VHX15_19045 [Frankiaceae bacterium]|nr:hypothetical protein [Frankiaceae bacterium]
MSDLPTWARVLLYAAGAIAAAVVLYFVVYLAVRSALRASLAEQRAAARRQEELLRGIATSAEYVADVADAWAEGEATRRAGGSVEALPIAAAAGASSPPPDHDHAGTGESGD